MKHRALKAYPVNEPPTKNGLFTILKYTESTTLKSEENICHTHTDPKWMVIKAALELCYSHV